MISSTRPGQSGEGRKQFFFEKKNQKTFAYWARACGQSQGVKVFCFFFSKKKAFLPCLTFDPSGGWTAAYPWTEIFRNAAAAPPAARKPCGRACANYPGSRHGLSRLAEPWPCAAASLPQLRYRTRGPGIKDLHQPRTAF
jgi:hypothetical protein